MNHPAFADIPGHPRGPGLRRRRSRPAQRGAAQGTAHRRLSPRQVPAAPVRACERSARAAGNAAGPSLTGLVWLWVYSALRRAAAPRTQDCEVSHGARARHHRERRRPGERRQGGPRGRRYRGRRRRHRQRGRLRDTRGQPVSTSSSPSPRPNAPATCWRSTTPCPRRRTRRSSLLAVWYHTRSCIGLPQAGCPDTGVTMFGRIFGRGKDETDQAVCAQCGRTLLVGEWTQNVVGADGQEYLICSLCGQSASLADAEPVADGHHAGQQRPRARVAHGASRRSPDYAPSRPRPPAPAGACRRLAAASHRSTAADEQARHTQRERRLLARAQGEGRGDRAAPGRARAHGRREAGARRAARRGARSAQRRPARQAEVPQAPLVPAAAASAAAQAAPAPESSAEQSVPVAAGPATRRLVRAGRAHLGRDAGGVRQRARRPARRGGRPCRPAPAGRRHRAAGRGA